MQILILSFPFIIVVTCNKQHQWMSITILYPTLFVDIPYTKSWNCCKVWLKFSKITQPSVHIIRTLLRYLIGLWCMCKKNIFQNIFQFPWWDYMLCYFFWTMRVSEHLDILHIINEIVILTKCPTIRLCSKLIAFYFRHINITIMLYLSWNVIFETF